MNRTAAAPVNAARTATPAKNIHIASSPAAARTWSPMNGPSANPTAAVLPNAPMYAPRTSSGASPATIDCEVGTQSISPTTKTTRMNASIGREALDRQEQEREPHQQHRDDELRAPAGRR